MRKACVNDVALVGESAMFHNASGCAVVRQGEGDDLVEVQLVEAILQCGDGDFGRETFAPVVRPDGVGEFDLVAAFNGRVPDSTVTDEVAARILAADPRPKPCDFQ